MINNTSFSQADLEQALLTIRGFGPIHETERADVEYSAPGWRTRRRSTLRRSQFRPRSSSRTIATATNQNVLSKTLNCCKESYNDYYHQEQRHHRG